MIMCPLLLPSAATTLTIDTHLPTLCAHHSFPSRPCSFRCCALFPHSLQGDQIRPHTAHALCCTTTQHCCSTPWQSVLLLIVTARPQLLDSCHFPLGLPQFPPSCHLGPRAPPLTTSAPWDLLHPLTVTRSIWTSLSHSSCITIARPCLNCLR